jgi:DNA-3-methyladenine glycosylase
MRLPRSFFARDTRTVARELLGMVLVRITDSGERLTGRIVETEAYRPGDAAMHAYRSRTARNEPLFQKPGTAYVYFTYGMHWCANLVTEAKAVPAAVLIRALEPLEGVEAMHTNYGRAIRTCDLCRGPARLCKALHIDGAYTGYDTLQKHSQLFVERGTTLPDSAIATSARIGVGGDKTAKTIAWRWFVRGCAFVSG